MPLDRLVLRAGTYDCLAACTHKPRQRRMDGWHRLCRFLNRSFVYSLRKEKKKREKLDSFMEENVFTPRPTLSLSTEKNIILNYYRIIGITLVTYSLCLIV